MNAIDNIRFWLSGEPYQNLNFFALMAANGMMENAIELQAPAQRSIRRIAVRIAAHARELAKPRHGFLEFLARHSNVAAFAPARWNALIVRMETGRECERGGANDNEGAAAVGPTIKAA